MALRPVLATLAPETLSAFPTSRHDCFQPLLVFDLREEAVRQPNQASPAWVGTDKVMHPSGNL